MHDQVSNGVAVFTNVMIPMRDGVRLAADIYLPSDGMTLCVVH
jgi:predicted acyl esterase